MPSLHDMLPSPAYLMLTQLKYTFDKLGKDESLKQSAKFFATGAINETPFNVIAASMYASLSQKAAAGQKKVPNQGTATDIDIVSILLPYCDAMFLDNGCRALLEGIPKNYKLPYPCAVFSPNIGGKFIKYLNDIRDSASAEHLQAVKETYGGDPLKPQKGIYGVGKRVH